MKIDKNKKFPAYGCTYSEGTISIENQLSSNMVEGQLGIQIAEDGRVWICVNGKSFLRFHPGIRTKETKILFDAHVALRETLRVWNWLVDHPDKYKAEVPDIRQYENAFNCPCCKYVQRIAELDLVDGMEKEACEALCPMWEAWGSVFCETGYHSPYQKWNHTNSWDSYDRAFFALLIVEWAEYLLIEDGGTL